MSSERAKTRLCDLLQEASSRFEAAGSGPVWSRYDSAQEISRRLMGWISKIREGQLSQAEALELWQVFAPTCDCDNVLGDAEFCEEVFREVDAIFGPRRS